MHRYLPHSEKDIKEMLQSLQLNNLDDLFDYIPKEALFDGEVDIPSMKSESELIEHLTSIANKNKVLKVFRGNGAYDHFTPLVINTITSRQEFLTSYTPYQPEIAQGTLQYIFEYQSLICELTGMDVTNASMYDGPTSAAEAMFVATSSLRRKKILISNTVSDRIKDVVLTYAKFRDIIVEEVNEENGITSKSDLASKMNNEIAGVLVQNPNKYGIVEDYCDTANIIHDFGGYLIDYVDPHTLSLLKTPAEMGADIAVGDGQSLGIPLSFGGPYVGFMALKEKLIANFRANLCMSMI